MRAGRVRLVLGAARRDARLLVPRPRRAGRRPRRDTVEGLADGERAAPGAGGVRRDGRGAVRVLHARAWSSPPPTCSRARPTRPTTRSARRSPATSAAAPATRRSSTRSAWPRGTAGDERHELARRTPCAAARRARISVGGGWPTPHPGWGEPGWGVRLRREVCGEQPEEAVGEARRRRSRREARVGRIGESLVRADGAEGEGRVRLLERPERAGDALGPHRPQPARARADPRDRHLGGASRCRASTPC